MNSFPPNCLKGIPNRTFLSEDNRLGSHLFHFQPGVHRKDGLDEQSINWEDDSQARTFTLNQTNQDGTLQFKAGYTVLSRGEIDRINKRPTIRKLISYERKCTPDNKYHGHLLLKNDVSKKTMKNIAATLAIAVSSVYLRDL